VVVRVLLAAAVALVVMIAVARVVKAADWQLMRQLPGAEWQQRGPALGQETACMTALASDGIVVPSGTKLRCERIIPTKEATR
jgi:hypothetical protein